MLEEKPGAYVWLSCGSAENGKKLHSARYDFNDNIIPIGVEYGVKLAHRALNL